MIASLVQSTRHFKKPASFDRNSRAQLAAQLNVQLDDESEGKADTLLDKVSKWVESKATDSQLLYLLNYMEQQSKSRLIVINGYDQKSNGSLSKPKMVLNFILCFWTFAITVRFGVLTWLKDDKLSTYLGDCFIGFYGRDVLNATTCIAYLVFGSIKFSLAYQESKSPITFLCFFNRLRNVKFRGNKLLLDPKNETKFRKLILILGYFILAATYAVWLPILAIHLFAMAVNPFFTYSLFFYQCIWLIFVHVPIYLSLQASWWFFFHLIVAISYATCTFNSLATFGQRVNNKTVKTNPQEIFAFFQTQQRQFNMIEDVNRQLSWGTFAGYVFGSLMSELIFFCSTYLGTGSIVLDNLMLYLGIGYFGALNSFNVFASKTQSQIHKCGLHSYRMTSIWPSNVPISFKAKAIFERLSSRDMAFYVGQMLPMDDFHFLIFILENASLYLLLITNVSATGRQ